MASISSITFEINRLLNSEDSKGDTVNKTTDSSDDSKKKIEKGNHGGHMMNKGCSLFQGRAVLSRDLKSAVVEGAVNVQDRQQECSNEKNYFMPRGILYNGHQEIDLTGRSKAIRKELKDRGFSCEGGRRSTSNRCFMDIPIVMNAAEVPLTEVSAHFSGRLLSNIVHELKTLDEDRILVLRRCHKLGFKSPQIITLFMKMLLSLDVERVYLLPSRVRCGREAIEHLRPSSVAFVLFDKALPRELLSSLNDQTEVTIAGSLVTLQRFLNQRDPSLVGQAPRVPAGPARGCPEAENDIFSMRFRNGAEETALAFDHVANAPSTCLGQKMSPRRAHDMGFENSFHFNGDGTLALQQVFSQCTGPLGPGVQTLVSLKAEGSPKLRSSCEQPTPVSEGQYLEYPRIMTLPQLAQRVGGEMGRSLLGFCEIEAPLNEEEQGDLEHLLNLVLPSADLSGKERAD